MDNLKALGLINTIGRGRRGLTKSGNALISRHAHSLMADGLINMDSGRHVGYKLTRRGREKLTTAAIRSTSTADLRAKLNLLLSIDNPTQNQSEMAEAIIEALASRIVEAA